MAAWKISGNTKIAGNISLKPFTHDEKECVKWLSPLKAVNVRDADTIDVLTLWSFTMSIRLKKISIFRVKDILEVGIELKKSWISA